MAACLILQKDIYSVRFASGGQNNCTTTISYYPNDAELGEDLLKNADMAMYKAKEGGRNTYLFYTEDMQAWY